MVTGSYTVTDTGGPADSAWDDSVYLAPGPTGTSYSTSDTLLQRIPQTQSLVAEGTYDGQYSFPLPDVAVGTYHLVVVPDSGDVLSGGNETPAASPGFTIGPIPTLTVGSPSPRPSSRARRSTTRWPSPRWPTCRSPCPDWLRPVTSPFWPSRARSPRPRRRWRRLGFVHLPSTTPGTWYVVVQPNAGLGSTPVPVTVAATDLGLTLTKVTPSTGTTCRSWLGVGRRRSAGQWGERRVAPPWPPPTGDGLLTLTLEGSGFGSDLAVTLVDGATTYSATSVTLRDSTVAFTSFPVGAECSENFGDPNLACTGVVPGTYDVTVSSGGHSAMLAHGFVLTTTVGGGVEGVDGLAVTLDAPYFIRQGWAGALTITMTNNTSQDIAVPVIDVSSDDALLGAPGVTDPTKFTPEVINNPVCRPTRRSTRHRRGYWPAGRPSPSRSGSCPTPRWPTPRSTPRPPLPTAPTPLRSTGPPSSPRTASRHVGRRLGRRGLAVLHRRREHERGSRPVPGQRLRQGEGPRSHAVE